MQMDNITINYNKNIISEQEKLLYIEELSQSYQASIQYDRSSTEYKGMAVIASFAAIAVSTIVSFTNNKLIGADFVNQFIKEYSACYFLFFSVLCLIPLILWTRNIASIQKQSSQYKRKIVLLRSILKIDYLKYDVLPKNSYLAAKYCFDIALGKKLFSNGFLSILYIDFILHFLLFFYLANIGVTCLSEILFVLVLGFIISFVFLSLTSCATLLDQHENLCLLFIKLLASLLNLKLQENFERVIYFNKMAVSESIRKNINLQSYYALLVAMEDQKFWKHHGIDCCRLIKISLVKIIKILRLLKLIKCVSSQSYIPIAKKFSLRLEKLLENKGGASTIVQQYVRSNYIVDYQKTKRRKVVEILLSAFWASKIFSKNDILNMYLTSVRFDRNIFGLIEANMRFYGHIIKNPSRAETFVLLDRLSNIKSEILSLSIINKIERALASKALQKEDIGEILDLYKNLIKKGVILDKNNRLREVCEHRFS